VIIKSKRIRARGQALKRALAHICDGEDNDCVVLLRGNLADLEDTRCDALRFGRQYCVRHWILSPEQEITRAQLDDVISRLAAEFVFDPERIVVWEHTKDRAAGDCGQHFRVLVAEVDPISGRVLSSSHHYDRQSKIARVLEIAWGHAIIAAPRMKSLVAALEREGDLKSATALQCVVAPDHPASFDDADHQRAKRSGVDLPRVREIVADALASATGRSDFETRLASVGLRPRTGENDLPIVETATERSSVHWLGSPGLKERHWQKGWHSVEQQKPQSRPNIHQATYRLVCQLAQQLEPVSRLAQETGDPNVPDPMEVIIELPRQVVNGIEQVQSRLEELEARLADQAVVKAIKSVRG
jgi:hypothetical protein